MLDRTSRRGSSPTAARAVSASAAVMAYVSTTPSGAKSSTAPRRCGRLARSVWRWSASGRSDGSCSPRWTISSSCPYAASSSTIAAPMNLVPPSTITRTAATSASSRRPSPRKAESQAPARGRRGGSAQGGPGPGPGRQALAPGGGWSGQALEDGAVAGAGEGGGHHGDVVAASELRALGDVDLNERAVAAGQALGQLAAGAAQRVGELHDRDGRGGRSAGGGHAQLRQVERTDHAGADAAEAGGEPVQLAADAQPGAGRQQREHGDGDTRHEPDHRQADRVGQRGEPQQGRADEVGEPGRPRILDRPLAEARLHHLEVEDAGQAPAPAEGEAERELQGQEPEQPPPAGEQGDDGDDADRPLVEAWGAGVDHVAVVIGVRGRRPGRRHAGAFLVELEGTRPGGWSVVQRIRGDRRAPGQAQEVTRPWSRARFEVSRTVIWRRCRSTGRAVKRWR